MPEENTQETTTPSFTQQQLDDAVANAVGGLKTKNADLIATNKTLKTSQLPDGVTQEDLDALSKFRAEQATAEETRLKDAGEFETIKNNINTEWQNKLEEQTSALAQTQKDLNDYVSRDAVMKALGEANALDSAELLMPHILPQVKSAKQEDGTFLTTTGTMTDTGEEKTLKHVVAEMKANPAFSKAFQSVNSGGGATGSSDSPDIGNNPFKEGGSRTEQAKLMNKDVTLARQMAKQAGVPVYF